MKTENLITALVADRSSIAMPIARTLALCCLAGALLAGFLFFSELGFRSDIATASSTIRFQFKFLFTVSLLVPALALVWSSSRPATRYGQWPWMSLVAAAVLALGCLVELAVIPPADWAARLVGSNSIKCLTSIPLLSLAPLAALLFGLSEGAPMRPAVAGALAGLAAAAFAATLYASNCTDDSPLFVATWYSIAIAGVTAIGAGLGSRLLRW